MIRKWLLSGSPLSDREPTELDRIATDKGFVLPAMCLWEAQTLHHKRRIEPPTLFSTWLRPATAVDDLPASFHGDPADRMIVATARVHHLSLATHDDAIKRSRLVKIWKPEV